MHNGGRASEPVGPVQNKHLHASKPHPLLPLIVSLTNISPLPCFFLSISYIPPPGQHELPRVPQQLPQSQQRPVHHLHRGPPAEAPLRLLKQPVVPLDAEPRLALLHQAEAGAEGEAGGLADDALRVAEGRPDLRRGGRREERRERCVSLGYYLLWMRIHSRCHYSFSLQETCKDTVVEKGLTEEGIPL